MANRGSQHVDAVTERRLKPIYDKIDNGNFKMAVQMADKLLKKHKDLQCAKVLKALALLRLGKRSESFELTQDVMAAKPVDENSLQALTICFKEMQKPDQIVELYTMAMKSNPTNEEFHTHLFMALVRVGDYKRQQQVAKELYKIFPKNPYFFWGVMSTILQALTSTDENLAQMMYLPLAEKMVEKMVKDGKIEAEAEVNIYLMILGYLNKYEKAIEVLNGELGKLLKAEVDACPIRKAELLCKMKRWADANVAYKNLLAYRPDNWMFCQQYLKTVLALVNENWCPAHTGENNSEKTRHPDYTIKMALDFLEETAEAEKKKAKVEGHPPTRGIILAKLELIRILDLSKEAKQIGSPCELMKSYFAIFGDRPCCYDDLCQFLPLLPPEDHTDFVKNLMRSLQIEVTDDGPKYANSVKQIYRHLCILKISRHLGLQDCLPRDEKLSLANELLKHCRATSRFCENLLSTDLQYGDEYLLMAVHLLLDVWEESEKECYLWRAIAMLEKGLTSSTSCHHMKLLLIRLYCIVGAFGPIPDLYDGLDIKHIQQDTIGYTVSGYVTSCGHFTSANALYNTTLKFFTSNHKDTTDYMITAYKFGTFHKIPEFLNFRQRISNSIHRAQIHVDKLLLELLTKAEMGGNKLYDFVIDMEVSPDKDDTNLDDITDNRDLGIIVSWAPPKKQLTSEDKEASFQQEKSWLRLRQLMLRSLAAATYLMPPSLVSGAANTLTNSSRSSSYEAVLGTLIEQLERHLAEAAEDPVTLRKFVLQGPPCSRMANYLKGDCGAIFVTALKVTLSVQELSKQQEECVELEQNIELQFTLITDTYTESLRRSRRCLIKENGDVRIFDRHVLPEVVLLVETLGFVVVLTGICYHLLKPMKAAATRKNKKKKSGSTVKLPVFQHFKDFVGNLLLLSDGLNSALLDIDPTMLSLGLGQLQLSADSQADVLEATSTVWKRIEKSYFDSSKELSDVLKSKRDYLATFKL